MKNRSPTAAEVARGVKARWNMDRKKGGASHKGKSTESEIR
jgi:hypothetical protein